ncbi:hypothetical protein PoB_000012400 [Plakobranchus ocellatus]|uniref:Uncharacterized protein n=1 Tax=Plakobranchus ocellatus TaxID=259542 RepID=A0AAV3XPY4_9GAST|nr:hypothetical protein PoB_000012400 [Plakobranchus ocellatus]
MSNSPHGKGNLARLPTMHKRDEALNTGYVSRQNFRMCTQDVRISTRYRQLSKTSEYAHKMSNSPHGVSYLSRLPNMHTRGLTLSTG